jgi:hypothetical protein
MTQLSYWKKYIRKNDTGISNSLICPICKRPYAECIKAWNKI